MSGSVSLVSATVRVAYVVPTYTEPVEPLPASIWIVTALGAPIMSSPLVVAVAVVGGTYTDDAEAHVSSVYVREKLPTVATIVAVYVAAVPSVAEYRTFPPTGAVAASCAIAAPARATVHAALSPGGSVPSSVVSNAASFPTVTLAGVIVVVPIVGHAYTALTTASRDAPVPASTNVSFADAADETTIVVETFFAVTYTSGSTIVAFVAVTELKFPAAVAATNSLFVPSGNTNVTTTGTRSPTTKASFEVTDADDGTARTASAWAYTTVSIGVASGLLVLTPSTSGAVVRATTVHCAPVAVRETPPMSAVSETTPTTPYDPAPSSIVTVTGTPVPIVAPALATAVVGGSYGVTPVPTAYDCVCSPSESTSVATCAPPAATTCSILTYPAPVVTLAHAVPSTLALAASKDPATANHVALVCPTLTDRAAVLRVTCADVGNSRATTPSVNTVPGPTTVSASVPLVALAVSFTRTVSCPTSETDVTASPVPIIPTLWLAVLRTNSNPVADDNVRSCVVSRPTTAPVMLVGLTVLATS